MIPVLYPYNEVNFTTRGYGALADSVSCTVTEELNGAYTLELKYPKNGVHQELLQVRSIIVAKPNRSKDREAFRIYKVDRRLKDYITVYANQLSYDLSGYMTIPATVTNIIFALQHLASGSGSGIGNFILNTTITSASSFRVDVPSSVRSWFGGKEGSLIDVYGGEWSYDFWTCSLLTSRGADKGLRVSYGVNLADYQKQQEDNMYSHVAAFYDSVGVDGGRDELWGSEAATGVTDIHRTLIINATNDYYNIGVIPTAAQLTTYATNYVTAHGSELVGDSQTITVAPEILATQEIDLGDTVHVAYNNDLISTRVVKTVWNTLAEKYDSITLGAKKTSIAETIKSLTLGGPSTGDIVIDNALNGSSTHPVQNKVIKNALDGKVNTSACGNIIGLSYTVVSTF